MEKSNIINNRAYTVGDEKLFSDLPTEKQQALINWIEQNIQRRNSANFKHSSYGLKQLAEKAIDFYISNNQFKDAMLFCGFHPVNPTELNWYYRISEESLVFKEVI